ncbi:MAG TPA: Bax inhibitor-1/YccA family protein [Pseudolabrys sp.]|nr:Bax inhibitor-1/YccA family protein [Pseudolabrys sp.]
MSDFDRNVAARGVGTARAAEIDVGLRAYMIRVYNYMASGVALTGVVSLIAFQLAGGDAIHITAGGITGGTPFGQAILGGFTPILLMLVALGLVFFINFRISTLQPSTALGLFLLYAGLLGLALTSIFVVYTQASIARTFFISAASFGALSLYGYTTQRDLSPIGSFLVMGLFGLIIAMVVQWWLKSPGLEFAISAIGVLIFAGLTAWDTQRIKEMYSVNDDGTVAGRKAVMGALTLYLDFINLFLFLLRFMGDRR